MVTNKSEAPKKTQEQLAAQMGISVDTLQNYKLLADMIPELSDLVDTGIVTKTTALAIMKELSEVKPLFLFFIGAKSFDLIFFIYNIHHDSPLFEKCISQNSIWNCNPCLMWIHW